MNRRRLYLPIEVKPREAHAKLFLAAKAAERGWQAVLGREREVRTAAGTGPSGALILGSILAADELRRYRARGHRIAILGEESIVYYGGRDYCERRIHRDGLALSDVLLVVGERNAADLRTYRPESTEKIAITGNPRFDIVMPKLRTYFANEATPMREKFGRFLLVNTNFGPVNHVKQTSAEILASLERRGLVKDANHADFLRAWHDYKRTQLAALKPVLAEIARSKRYDHVVVRPHPTENHETWKAWADPMGIAVHFQGSANSWMLAATDMLHTGCTTAVEGALLDLPMTSFVPIPGHEMLNQADEISAQVATAADFMTLAGQPKAARLAEQKLRVQSIVANTDPPLAADRVLDTLDRLDVPAAPVERSRMSPLASAWHWLHSVTRRKSSYAYRKFDGLEEPELRQAVEVWTHAGVLKQIPQMSRQPDGTWLIF